MKGDSQKNNKINPKAQTKKKHKKRKHPVLFAIFIALFCLFASGVLTVVVVSSSVLSYVDTAVDGKKIVDLDIYKNSQSQTSILYAYDENNKPVEQYRLHGEENRIWVDYDEMPENLIWAFVCLEDKRFFEHSGVDWIRTIGVLINPSYEGQGGSTITQQLIKNLTDQKDVTYLRKFNEIIRALNMEKNFSKKDILEAYLNTVYLGAGCYGVETAAETYFGKTVSELNLIECATLAGITKAPYSLNPYVNYDKCIERQQTCLWYMHDQGKITDKQYNKALKSKIKLLDQKSNQSNDKKDDEDILSWYDEYVIDQVIADLQSEYGYEYNEAWRMVYYGGLSIYSAVDLDMQSWLESVYKDRLGFPSSGRDSKGNLPQSSMTIMDYQGRIVALVGGTGEKTTNRAYNRATDNRAKRQPGSSIKPLSVYAPAIDTGILSPSSTILEKAITADGRTWPRNFNGDYGSGNYVTVENALVRSLNTVPARILKEMLGLETSYEYCNDKFKLHLSDTDIGLSQLAVGGTNTGVTTLEMAAAFATFGNGGKYYKAYSYYKVLDRNGEVLLDNTKNEAEQVIKPETAQAMLGMMTKAVTQSNGTGYGSKINRFQTFAKTGTTSDNCDKWYCGGTPYYVASVWYGYDYRSNLYTGGSNPSKTIFKYVFEEIHDELKEKTFDDVLEEVGVDKDKIGKIDTDITVKTSDYEEKTEKNDTTTASTTKATTESKTSETTQEKTTQEKTTQEKTTQEKTTQEKTTEATTHQQTTKSTTVPSTTAPTTAVTTAAKTQPSTEAPTQPPASSEKPKVSDTTQEQKSTQSDDGGGEAENPEVIW